MGADLSKPHVENPVQPAAAPEPAVALEPEPKHEPKPVVDANEAYIHKLERELKEKKAELEKEKRDRAAEVEALTRLHETELELYAAQVTKARCLDEAAAASADVQRLAEERALHLMQQRLNSVMEVDDATFEYITGPLGFDKRDFPFASLKPGRLPDGTLVLRIQLEESFKGNQEVVLRFKKTLAIMQALNGGDGTLLRLIGASNLDSDDPIAYVEYVTGMTLSAYLMDKQDATWSEKLHIAVQIAKALTHIHNLAVMHRDLSWSRVYVDAKGNVKVFAGLKMRQVQAYETYLTSGVSEARWGAPETLPKPQGGENGEPDSSDSATTYTDKIDIFGLGLILISLVTRDLPFTYVLKTSGRPTSIDDNLVAAKLAKRETAIPMLTQSFDVDYACPSEEYKELALECIRYDAERRPTAPQVVRRLEIIRQAYGGFKTPDHAKVDLTIAVLKTSGLPNPKMFGSPYDMWCELRINDENRDRIQLNPVTGNVTHLFNQYATLHDIEPLTHTVEIHFMTTIMFKTKTLWTVSIPLMELVTLEDNESSLTAVRKKTRTIHHDGNDAGVVVIAVQFGERIRGYLELYERQATEYLRNTEDGPSTLDLRKKRDVAAAALLCRAP
ncbi:TKL protein kinase [Saprolegnia parasitica CBS 223.65]|uniref:TKL protein kinase n=1 Tax=Saprolegnia parasitica (strain CBS 223.65) TaxID=695850 RepID=A0A067C4M4_SAPPC|nr:TKL protein kinase [Saprolegnia parasitica CBS 223.65]KDO25694.1 TKL protein kinase [Saprolegnia parasitica CBS 223.65]|eukprot:XP_012203504.1 TKL protein kinase [Saprolegnia parasitica CBS 223.65]